MPALVRAATTDDAADIARVHVESWRTTYRGIIPDGVLAALSYERREQGWREAAMRVDGDGRTPRPLS